MRVLEKVAVVVGAGQTAGDTIGNGRAIAVLLARDGARANFRHGVRANGIMPGLLDTPMAIAGHTAARGIGADELRSERNASVPLAGGMGTAWDTAYATLDLASDESRFITGVILPVDGGQSARIG